MNSCKATNHLVPLSHSKRLVMKSKSALLLFWFFCTVNFLYAQPGFDVVSNGGGNFQMNMYYDPAITVNGIPYEQIKGSPFLSDKWMPASIYNQKNEIVGKLPVRFNLATGELYVLQGDKTIVAEKQMAGKVVIHSTFDAIDVKAVFLNNIPNLFLNGKSITDFVEVFHTGYAILLKYRTKEVVKSEGGGGMPKYYYFKNSSFYFLQVNGKVERLNRLSIDLIEQLPGAYNLQKWAEEQKLNFKKEEDVIRFINYYNQVKEKESVN